MQSTFRNAQVLITGGAGFIGVNLARRLFGLGAHVTVIDGLVPGHGGSLYHVGLLKPRADVLLEPVESLSEAVIERIARADYVFHLAGQSHHWDSMERPLKDLQSNCAGTLALLDTCRRHNPSARIVFASTRQVYGVPASLPVDEQHPLRPVDVNGIHKMAAEQYHLLYHKVFRLPVTIARLTNTYGPGMRICDANQTFLGHWIGQALEGNLFEVWGGGQSRDFNYVDDVVDALLLMTHHPDAIGKVYNLGGDEACTLKALATLLTGMTGAPHVDMDFPAERKSIDIGDYFASFDLIRRELGWQPAISLREGLGRTLAYFRAHDPRYQTMPFHAAGHPND